MGMSPLGGGRAHGKSTHEHPTHVAPGRWLKYGREWLKNGQTITEFCLPFGAGLLSFLCCCSDNLSRGFMRQRQSVPPSLNRSGAKIRTDTGYGVASPAHLMSNESTTTANMLCALRQARGPGCLGAASGSGEGTAIPPATAGKPRLGRPRHPAPGHGRAGTIEKAHSTRQEGPVCPLKAPRFIYKDRQGATNNDVATYDNVLLSQELRILGVKRNTFTPVPVAARQIRGCQVPARQ
jgi:hypothetical protein